MTASGQGYRVVTLGGSVSGFGDAAIVPGAAPTGGAPIVGIATTRTGFGYWLLALDGTVTAHGDAPALGAAPNGGRQRPAVGIAGPGSGSSGFAYSLFRSRLPGGFASAGTWPGARQVALTFDDGPNPAFTPEVLDILARENVPATFFAVGWAAERYPALARRAVDEGHSVQNHTWAHETLTRLDRAAAAANLAAHIRRDRTRNRRATDVLPAAEHAHERRRTRGRSVRGPHRGDGERGERRLDGDRARAHGRERDRERRWATARDPHA